MLPQHSPDLFPTVVLPAAMGSQAGTLLMPHWAQVLLHEQNHHGQCDLQHIQGSLEILFQLPEMKYKQIIEYWVLMFSCSQQVWPMGG